MPALAAHYQFGTRVLSSLDEQCKELAEKHIDLFTLGFQGPDLLFYYKPIKSNPISSKGHDIHVASAKDLFNTAILDGKCTNSAVLAYLMGCCCHFALDRACHPFVIDAGKGDPVHHRSLESDFDLAVIEKYRLDKARYKFIPQSVDAEVIAKVYNITAEQAKTALFSMRRNERLLDFYHAVKLGESLIGKKDSFSSMCLKKEVYFKDETAYMLNLFSDAVPVAVKLVSDYYRSAKKGIALDDFAENFEGRTL